MLATSEATITEPIAIFGDMVPLTKVAWELGQRYHSNVFVRKSNVTYIVSTRVGTILHLVGGNTLEVIEKMGDVAARLA